MCLNRVILIQVGVRPTPPNRPSSNERASSAAGRFSVVQVNSILFTVYSQTTLRKVAHAFAGKTTPISVHLRIPCNSNRISTAHRLLNAYSATELQPRDR